MTHLRRHWLPALLGLCAVLTLGLLVWPPSGTSQAQRPPVERYAGPDVEMRRSGPVQEFALRLGRADAAPAAAPSPAALPVLVGLAGRRAYLRSTATGEVEGVAIGQTLDGWRLVAVSARSAILRGPDGDRRLDMFAAGSGASATDPTTTALPTPSVPSAAGG